MSIDITQNVKNLTNKMVEELKSKVLNLNNCSFPAYAHAFHFGMCHPNIKFLILLLMLFIPIFPFMFENNGKRQMMPIKCRYER